MSATACSWACWATPGSTRRCSSTCSRWFDRRRGSALALISSGGYLAGFIWPTVFERAIANFGWQSTMVGFAVVQLVVIVPLAIIFLRSPPEVPRTHETHSSGGARSTVLGWHPNVAFVLIAFAAFPAASPCRCRSSIWWRSAATSASPARSAPRMLSVLLGMGFFSRQGWGWLSDRTGGLITAFFSSILQCAAMSGFLFTQDTAGLFTVATAFGLGFSALIPAYVLTIRDLYPESEAHWRVPVVLLYHRHRHGHRRLARRLSLRHLWLLHSGLCDGRCLQHRQHRDPVHSAGASALYEDAAPRLLIAICHARETFITKMCCRAMLFDRRSNAHCAR